MGRIPRIEEEGLVYHVIQRGNNQEFIFGDDTDKEYLTGQFKLLCSTGYDIYGYVIMGNHYHLVLRSFSATLQSAMHRLNLRYSKYFNRKHGHTGHVFQGRYKAIPVRNDEYLLSLLRYVHQNPVRAGVCQGAEEYIWSSDSFYRENKNDWVKVAPVLDMLSNHREAALKMYIEFMADEETGNYESIMEAGKTSESHSDLQKEEELLSRKSLDEILLSTGVNEQEFRLIKKGSRKRDLTVYKLAYALEALELNYTLKAIGDNIQVSDVAIFDMIKKTQ